MRLSCVISYRRDGERFCDVATHFTLHKAKPNQIQEHTGHKIEMQPFEVEMIRDNYATLLDALTKYQTTRIILLSLSVRKFKTKTTQINTNNNTNNTRNNNNNTNNKKN